MRPLTWQLNLIAINHNEILIQIDSHLSFVSTRPFSSSFLPMQQEYQLNHLPISPFPFHKYTMYPSAASHLNIISLLLTLIPMASKISYFPLEGRGARFCLHKGKYCRWTITVTILYMIQLNDVS